MKRLKPKTPGTRGAILPSFSEVTSGTPHKSLTRGGKRSKGRAHGTITTRHRGGGHKKRYRLIDFAYEKVGIPATVETVEYDPYRTAFIALLRYNDGERRYILAPSSISVGTKVVTDEKAPVKVGNRMRLKNIPVGVDVYAIEIKPKGGAKLVRSAGVLATLSALDGKYATIKLPSGEIRRVPDACFASIGKVSHEEYKLRVIGKAGRNRHRGRRPVVRGSAMNPVDHPHGGGEGRAGRGRRRAVSKWGKPTGKGQKTRKPKKYSDRLVIKHARSKKKK